jgi:hypothetical protein
VCQQKYHGEICTTSTGSGVVCVGTPTLGSHVIMQSVGSHACSSHERNPSQTPPSL